MRVSEGNTGRRVQTVPTLHYEQAKCRPHPSNNDPWIIISIIIITTVNKQVVLYAATMEPFLKGQFPQNFYFGL